MYHFVLETWANNLIRSWMILVEFWSIATEHCGLEVSDLRQFSDNLIGIFFSILWYKYIWRRFFFYKKWIVFGSFAQELLEIYAWQPLKLTPRDIFLPVTPSGTPSALIIQAHECLGSWRSRRLRHGSSWRHQMETFSALQAICVGNSPVNSPHKGQWRGALMISLICAWINGWRNICDAGDLRRHRAHYDIKVMCSVTVVANRSR